jgi:hypothetical protein
MNIRGSSSKSSSKAPQKGQVPQGVCKFYKQAAQHMKDCVEFLKWLYKKGIPFREWWTIRVVNIMSTIFQDIERLSFCNKQWLLWFISLMSLCAFLENDFLVQVLML